jgi:TonB family protein
MACAHPLRYTPAIMLPVLVWIFVTTGATQAPAAAASLPSAEPIQFVRYASMKAHATVAGDVVKVTGGAGDPLLSSIQVGDFELSGDVRIASPRTDAAILVRALARGDRQDRRLYAILIGDATDPQHLAGTVIGQDAGVRFTIEPDASGAHRAGLTTWQHFDIRCAGRHLRVFEDGRLLTDADVPDESYGRVGVEVSKGAIELRDWRVTSLDRFRDTRPLLESLANPDAVDGEKKIPGLVVPRKLREFKPTYTEAAMRQKVTGTLALEAIVEKDGTVGPVRIVRPLNDELDLQGVRAVRRWLFSPGSVDQRPVRCRVFIELTFTLK